MSRLLLHFHLWVQHDSITAHNTFLEFELEIDSTDDDAYFVNNLSQSLIKEKIRISLGNTDVHTLLSADILNVWKQLWLPSDKRVSMISEGIGSIEQRKRRTGQGADTSVYHNKVLSKYGMVFHYPLDFTLLNDHLPFKQSSLSRSI